MMTMWWKNIYGKVIPMYIQELKADERSVEVDEQGDFINVFVRVAELEGKIGRIELEANENLPVTWSQRKDTYMKLLETQNEKILEALSSPENIKNLAEAIGLDDFTVPGQDDIDKQREEIRLLVNSEPIEQPPSDEELMAAVEQGATPEQLAEVPPTQVPSVEIDFDLDNHQLEADICRSYLVSPAGRLLKTENQAGYQNVLLHMKAHLEAIKQKMMEDMQQQMVMQQSQQAMAPEGTNQPLTENANVATES